MTSFTRRNFLRTSVIGGVAATFIKPFDIFAASGKQEINRIAGGSDNR